MVVINLLVNLPRLYLTVFFEKRPPYSLQAFYSNNVNNLYLSAQFQCMYVPESVRTCVTWLSEVT